MEKTKDFENFFYFIFFSSDSFEYIFSSSAFKWLKVCKLNQKLTWNVKNNMSFNINGKESSIAIRTSKTLEQ